ncbi:hypothetical protein BRC77_00570 [Halobacteriales archaeon QH_8_64_26]|nr:MAG: hypothetical protein BRC77_00570 [Halobacteriales archaeon QH_8_64_26]
MYPGCGYDNNWDLGLSEGEPGFDHVALRLGNTAELDEYEDLLAGNGVDYTRAESEEPGVHTSIGFELPSEKEIEFVSLEDYEYHYAVETLESRQSTAPRDADHVALMSHELRQDIDFLRDTAGFRITSELQEDGQSVGAFTRFGDRHHDIAWIAGPPEFDLHHLAWEMNGSEHLMPHG